MSNTHENQIFAFTIVSIAEGLFIIKYFFLVILKWKNNLYVVYFK